MLTVSNLTKTFGDRTLFSGASLQINRGERYGLVGPNGAGKTTLFALILGQQEAEGGAVELQKGASLGFLPQESAPAGEETVLELATAVSPEMAGVQAQLRDYPDPTTPEHQEAFARYAELDGPKLEPIAKKILSQLAFRGEGDFQVPARTLSGGWIMRAHLARLLVMKPDLLMLDEPTNHLDLETLGWFQEHLSHYPGAVLTISHDRAFLNGICDHIVEIANQRLHSYTGNYDDFISQRAERREQQRKAYENQQREIAQIETFINRFRAKNTKASQVQSRIKYLEKLERIEPPEDPEATVSFKFPQPGRSGQRVAALDHVHQAYGDHVVYEDLSLTVERGERIVLVGPNGAGKSTLLKILAGFVPIQGGSRALGLNVTVGYFSQQRTEVLEPTVSVLEEARRGARGVSEQATRDLLGSFLFRGDDVHKQVGILSGGEKSRLALVKLLLNPPNCLLLDEPTTHLDIASIDALIAALKDYTGTLVFVSHDVHFIRRIAREVIHIGRAALGGGDDKTQDMPATARLTRYHGDYDYYLYKSRASDARSALVAGGATLSNSRPGSAAPAGAAASSLESSSKSDGSERKGPLNDPTDAKERRRSAAENRRHRARLRQRVADLEKEIERLEARQAELTERLADPGTYADAAAAKALNEEVAEVDSQLERTTAEWAEEAEALEG